MKIMLQGAGWFWIPDIVVHALARGSFSGKHVLLISILLPILCIAWLFYSRRKESAATPIRLALAAVLGIWLLGPLAITASVALSGDFHQQSVGETLRFIGMGTILFPMYTFLMSAYDGTLGALLVVTVGLPAIGAFPLSKR